jgi:uncharacterized protein (TIGR03083 family)
MPPPGLRALGPLDAAPLCRPLHAELITLLRGLPSADWQRPTAAARWRVRDVAAHLLDGMLRKTAVYRDEHPLPLATSIASDADLARFVNGLNASGVAYAERLSPRLITDLLQAAGGWAADVIEALAPHAPARFPVSWAGEAASANWMDTGREYTEWWHHQAQIRDAVGAPPLLERRWFEPLMAFSVRALPVAYAGVEAPPGTTVALLVDGAAPSAWSVVRTDAAGWRVFAGAPPAPAASVRLDGSDAWRLFYNALSETAMAARLRVDGDAALARPLLRARSVIL